MKIEVFFSFTFLLCTIGTEAGVSQCYTCNRGCQDPLQIENCEAADEFDYGCLMEVAQLDGEAVEFRGCALNDPEIIKSCEYLDTFEGSSCSICAEDLCNV